jgi:hypothetical protein
MAVSAILFPGQGSQTPEMPDMFPSPGRFTFLSAVNGEPFEELANA